MSRGHGPNGRAPRRSTYLRKALELMGTPYIWGGRSTHGIDCSGLVTVALWEAGGPDWRLTHNTDRLWVELDPVGDPLPGDLVFYGGRHEDDVEHVMIVLCLDVVFGACGGGSRTTTLAEAQRHSARVKTREPTLYRADLRGFRSLGRYFA